LITSTRITNNPKKILTIRDYKHQDYKPAFGREAVFSTKNPNKGDSQYWSVLPLAQKYSTLQMFLASFYLTTQLLKITKGWEAEGLEKEAKVCFIPLIPCFSSSVPPSSTVPGLL
jgi:hypothetical protein